MAERIMYVQLKTGYDGDRGPAWIALVSFRKSWRTLTFHGRRLRRVAGMAFANADANFYDVETGSGIGSPGRDVTAWTAATHRCSRSSMRRLTWPTRHFCADRPCQAGNAAELPASFW